MEAINSNGFHIDDELDIDLIRNTSDLYKNKPFSDDFHSKKFGFDNMAPRSHHIQIPFSDEICQNTFDSTEFVKYGLLNNVNYESDIARSSAELFNDKVVVNSASGIENTMPSIKLPNLDARIRQLSTKFRAVERKTCKLLSRIAFFSSKSSKQPTLPTPIHLISEACSRNTESSSDDNETYSDGITTTRKVSYLSDRCVVRSHWHLLKSEIVRANDCLHNLKTMQQCIKKWRKSLPLPSHDKFADDERSIRCQPFNEHAGKARHVYHDLSLLSKSRVPGSELSMNINLPPLCRTTSGCSCVLCCAIFKDVSLAFGSETSNLAFRSISLDQIDMPIHMFPGEFDVKQSHNTSNLKEDRAKHSYTLSPHISPKLYNLDSLHLNRKSSIKDSHLEDYLSEVPSNCELDCMYVKTSKPQDVQASSSISNAISSNNEVRNITIPMWRIVQPRFTSIPDMELGRKFSAAQPSSMLMHTFHSQNSLVYQNHMPAYKLEIFCFDEKEIEETSDEHYERLHGVEEAKERCRNFFDKNLKSCRR